MDAKSRTVQTFLRWAKRTISYVSVEFRSACACCRLAPSSHRLSHSKRDDNTRPKG